MKLTRYHDAEAFRQQVEPFLLQHEAENNLILGILASLTSATGMYDFPPYLAAVDHAGEVVGVSLRTPPFNVLCSLLLPADRAEIIALFAIDLRAEYGQLPGVTADAATAHAFAEEWRRLTGEPYRIAIAERIYQLDRVIPVAGVPGKMRRATPADRDLLLEWIIAFQAETATEGTNPERWVEQALTSDVRSVYLWEDQQPVAMAGCGGFTVHGARIGPVYTPPSLRGHGYASACTAALSQLLLDQGRQFCFLYTDLSNPTSNKIYQAIGYWSVIDADLYRFGSV